ncbi:hypothetical protein P280DRAFT_478339 [Massarina eburnea CBS 473.64]|uniref:Uncharacterized protein n=1 Tax=Massarina eburnea CBS 473.64 TaxID=1395130 RepID=A0A6A6SBP6_9PLEO|nr:hypothetical protein P280DRAFT_478339 [Massarina eburnea CBS 473.64]
MATHPGPIRKLWYQWKMMQLPWRKQWLIGFDLKGNTYWEFKDALHSHRHRRIVKYSVWTHHGDVNVPPQWVQWLRHTRYEAPSIAEQQADVYRQDRMKVLAAQADARWAAKPSALDAPDKGQPVHMLESRELDGKSEGQDRIEKEQPEEEKTRKRTRTEPKDSPWKQQAKGNPGDAWQPAAWAPPPRRRT